MTSHKCAAKTLKGDPCKKKAVEGSKFCAIHGKKKSTKTTSGKARTKGKTKVATRTKTTKADACKDYKVVDLKKMAKGKDIKGYSKMKKAELCKALKLDGTKPKAKGSSPPSDDKQLLTGYKPVDVKIASMMSDKDFYNLCTSNKATMKICMSMEELKKKFKRGNPHLLEKVIHDLDLKNFLEDNYWKQDFKNSLVVKKGVKNGKNTLLIIVKYKPGYGKVKGSKNAFTSYQMEDRLYRMSIAYNEKHPEMKEKVIEIVRDSYKKEKLGSTTTYYLDLVEDPFKTGPLRKVAKSKAKRN